MAVTILVAVLLVSAGYASATITDIDKVTFSDTITVAGKDLKLMGVADRTYLWYRVVTGGLYLERPTQDPRDVIESEQIKCIHEYFSLAKVQSLWIRKGITRLLKENNPEELVEKYRDKIRQFASWFDADAPSGTKIVVTYIPGSGLTLEYDGVLKGTVPGREFACMYFRSIFGEGANEKTKKGFLGIE